MIYQDLILRRRCQVPNRDVTALIARRWMNALVRPTSKEGAATAPLRLTDANHGPRAVVIIPEPGRRPPFCGRTSTRARTKSGRRLGIRTAIDCGISWKYMSSRGNGKSG